jgi:hypothetical protein
VNYERSGVWGKLCITELNRCNKEATPGDLQNFFS